MTRSDRSSTGFVASIYNRTVYSLYSLLLFLALIVSTPWWLLQMLRHGKYRTGWSERLGTVPDRLFNQVAENTIWIHAVSVGEVLAISRVVEELKAQLPGWRIVVSTTTDTGQKLARERFGENNVFYLPLDLPCAVRAYLQALRPKLLVLAESEFWPNLLHEAHKSGAAVAVVNARVSDRSLPGYLRFHGLLRRVMQNVDLFLAQSDEDANRLVQIGAPAGSRSCQRQSEVRGEAACQAGDCRDLRQRAGARGDRPADRRGQHAGGRRGDAAGDVPAGCVAISGRAAGAGSATSRALRRRSLPCLPRPACAGSGAREWDGARAIAGGIFLLDTIGELASLYEFADIAFVGGSLVPRGGHNVLEAAQFGAAILVGPHTENFRDIVDVFRRGRRVARRDSAIAHADCAAACWKVTTNEPLWAARAAR